MILFNIVGSLQLVVSCSACDNLLVMQGAWGEPDPALRDVVVLANGCLGVLRVDVHRNDPLGVGRLPSVPRYFSSRQRAP